MVQAGNAYTQQWEAMDERSQHAVKLVGLAHQLLEMFERGYTIARISEIFSGLSDPAMRFTSSEIEFAVIEAARAREAMLKNMALKLYNQEELLAALAAHQTENAAIELQKLKEQSL